MDRNGRERSKLLECPKFLTSTHNFAECERRWIDKAPIIIEKCLKQLFLPENLISIPVKRLTITDQSKIWTLTSECINIIINYCQGLECLDVSGRRMLPIEASSVFFDQLDVSNLRHLRLTGVDENRPMWILRGFKTFDGKPIRKLIERCSKLENLLLNIGPIQHLNTTEFKFPSGLQVLCFYNFVYNHCVNDFFHFRNGNEFFDLSSLANCRSNLVQLYEYTNGLRPQNLENLNANFPNLSDLSVSFDVYRNVDLAILCAAHPRLRSLNLRNVYPEDPDQANEIDLSPIRGLIELTALYMEFCSPFLLTSEVVASFLHPHLRKVGISAHCTGDTLLRIAQICGTSLEELDFEAFGNFDGTSWPEFLQQSTRLRSLHVANFMFPKFQQMVANLPYPHFERLKIDSFAWDKNYTLFSYVKILCEDRLRRHQTSRRLIWEFVDTNEPIPCVSLPEKWQTLLHSANVELSYVAAEPLGKFDDDDG